MSSPNSVAHRNSPQMARTHSPVPFTANSGTGPRDNTTGSRPTSASTINSDDNHVFAVEGDSAATWAFGNSASPEQPADATGVSNLHGVPHGFSTYKEAASLVNRRPKVSTNGSPASSYQVESRQTVCAQETPAERIRRIESSPSEPSQRAFIGTGFSSDAEFEATKQIPARISEPHEAFPRGSRPPMHDSPASRGHTMPGRSTAEAPSSPFSAQSPSGDGTGTGFSSRRRFSSGSSRSGSPPRRHVPSSGAGSIASKPSEPFSTPGSAGSRDDSDHEADTVAHHTAARDASDFDASTGVHFGRRSQSDEVSLTGPTGGGGWTKGALRTQSQKLVPSSGIACATNEPEQSSSVSMSSSAFPSEPHFRRSHSTGSRKTQELLRHNSMTPFRSATLQGGGSLPPLLVANKVAVITPVGGGGARGHLAIKQPSLSADSSIPSAPEEGANVQLQRHCSEPPQNSGSTWAMRPSLSTAFQVQMQDVITSPTHDTNGPEGFEPEGASGGHASEDEDEACCGLDLEDEGGWGVLDASPRPAQRPSTTVSSSAVEEGGSFHGVVGISTTSADGDSYVAGASRSRGGAPSLDVLREEQNEGGGDADDEWHIDGARRRTQPVLVSSPTAAGVGGGGVGFAANMPSPRLDARRRRSSAEATPRLQQPSAGRGHWGGTRMSSGLAAVADVSPTEVSL